MKIKIFPAFLLFLASYFPLSLILLLQDVSEASWNRPFCRSLHDCSLPELVNATRSLSLFGICLISLVFFLIVMKMIPGDHNLTVKEAKPAPNDLINYVFPYVVSFMGLDLGSTGKLCGFLVFLGWMFLITYRSGQILMNPLLIAAGWQLHEVTVRIGGSDRTGFALAKVSVNPGDGFKYSKPQNGVYVLTKKESK
ncbi:hypothetical protein [Pseudomonas baetica]|uniref:hypothetical protein n=1 Tax=Pseudomonas baetica TaxID=674054 RepID=UPI0028729BFE|nr:hypothetical protein [Pseudomonas baetica]MDR9862916.1 hypothetical protein [Pseudomonas baetica]